MKINNGHLAIALVLASMAISGCSQQPAVVEPAVAAPVQGYVPEAEPEMQQPAPPQQQEWVDVQPQQPPMVQPVQQRPIVVPRPKMPAQVVVPRPKAKGTYRGAVQIDRGAVQQYQY